ncbi:MAG: DNA topoisomerase IV [Flavobacteriaceae bacterium]|nr:DNA topoisomerase IV [Flavobacteriaceae bacterium]
MKKTLFVILLSTLFFGCYDGERNCDAVRTGKFEFVTEVNQEKVTSVFERFEKFEVEYFNQKVDTSTVRWVNNCEYILQHKTPKNRAEQKAVHIKILTTDESGYTFEYGIVGESQKSKGRVNKITE